LKIPKELGEIVFAKTARLPKASRR
jgi:hypothetical protein